MLKKLSNNTAQAVMGEYLLIFLVVIGTLTAMTLYFKRAMQARVYDARNHMFNLVEERVKNGLPPSAWYGIQINTEYEPYYINTESVISRSGYEEKQLKASYNSQTGIFISDIDETTSVQTVSETAPPKDAQ